MIIGMMKEKGRLDHGQTGFDRWSGNRWIDGGFAAREAWHGGDAARSIGGTGRMREQVQA
nr:hypothetical protein [Planococcus sp. NCCP-2050]